ncbi:hypothetical protein [Saccharothrix sp. HUAS TT1]|uniref:hypothetical protein n=1 Tax=unclassified Saccharothrix TaxID=2593673 RepID=UPI00345C0CF5
MSRRLLGAALLVAAGVAAAVGTFLPLFWEGTDFEGARYGFTTTSWDVVPDAGHQLQVLVGRSPQFGVPIVISSALLVVAAALAFLPESQRLAARYSAITGAALMVGAVWTTEAYAVWVVGRASEVDPLGYRGEAGAGVWVLGASALAAVLGAVLLHARRSGAPRPEGAVVYRVDDDGEVAGDDDVDTPPFGIPVVQVEVAQIPESRYERPADGSGGTP